MTILPTLSIIIPTYNSTRTFGRCISSILNQDYPRKNIEIIIVDGGSDDDTIKIAKELGVNIILNNPLKIEEAGKPIAIDMASNDIIAFIDSDNILPSPNWLKKIVKPFEDSEIIGSEPLYYKYRKNDGLITRYCSLIGGDDAVYPYLGRFDRMCHFKDKWTETPLLSVEDKRYYLKIRFDKNNIPTMGANGFFVRKELIKKIKYKPLHLHEDTIYKLVSSGYNCIAKVKVGIVHLHGESITTYVKKKVRRIQKRFLWKNYGEHNKEINRLKMFKFILFNITLFPLAVDTIKGYKKIPDHAWFFHFIACFLSLLTYGLGSLVYRRSIMDKISKVPFKEQNSS